MFTRPVWAEISRERLLSNHAKLRQAVSPYADLMPVVKANAYGHDLLLCAPLLVRDGAGWLGVTGTEEGMRLRAVCPQTRILLMSGIWPAEADAAIEHALTPVVWEEWHLDRLEEAAAKRGLLPGSLPVHLEVDTGMSRQGIRVMGSDRENSELDRLLRHFHSRSPLRLEGVMTHFSVPEELSPAIRKPQMAALSAALDFILGHSLKPQWLHAGNSVTVLAGHDRQELLEMASRMGGRLMLRPGLALYGYLDRLTFDGKPVNERFAGGIGPEDFQPVLEWKARVTSLRTLRQGESVGYGDTYVTHRKTLLALLPAGYADGISRLLSNRGHVLIRGHRAPIAGRVSMDQMVVDVTDIPGAAIADEAVLLGTQGDLSISAWDIADLMGTIPWEVLCAISCRVPRKQRA